MIFNAGDYVGIPWEVVIKSFRAHLGKKSFYTVEQCEFEFFKYLDSSAFTINDAARVSIISLIIGFIDEIKKQLEYKNLRDLQDVLRAAIRKRATEIESENLSLSGVIPKDKFVKEFRGDISVVSKEAFGFRLTKEYFSELIDFLYLVISRNNESVFMTGVVFAGYGKDQLLPYISQYVVDGRFSYYENKKRIDKTRCWLDERIDLLITVEDHQL